MERRGVMGASPEKDWKHFASPRPDRSRDDEGNGEWAGKRSEGARDVGTGGRAERRDAMFHGDADTTGEEEEATAINEFERESSVDEGKKEARALASLLVNGRSLSSSKSTDAIPFAI